MMCRNNSTDLLRLCMLLLVLFIEPNHIVHCTVNTFSFVIFFFFGELQRLCLVQTVQRQVSFTIVFLSGQKVWGFENILIIVSYFPSSGSELETSESIIRLANHRSTVTSRSARKQLDRILLRTQNRYKKHPPSS